MVKSSSLTCLMSELRAVRRGHGEVRLPDGGILAINLLLQHGQEPDSIDVRMSSRKKIHKSNATMESYKLLAHRGSKA